MTHNEYRTHNCGELRIGEVGKQVTLAGWINSSRKLGGLTFVTLRDHFGITQLILDQHDLPNKESVISITGTVIERESKNPKMPTGDIEIKVDTIKVLGSCNNALPFEISLRSSIGSYLQASFQV